MFRFRSLMAVLLVVGLVTQANAGWIGVITGSATIIPPYFFRYIQWDGNWGQGGGEVNHVVTGLYRQQGASSYGPADNTHTQTSTWDADLTISLTYIYCSGMLQYMNIGGQLVTTYAGEVGPI